MKKYLVKSKVSWADEINFDGFDIFTEDELRKAIHTVKSGAGEQRLAMVGIAQPVEIDKEDVLSELEEADEISQEAYMILLYKLGSHYGKTKYRLWKTGESEEDENTEEDYDETE